MREKTLKKRCEELAAELEAERKISLDTRQVLCETQRELKMVEHNNDALENESRYLREKLQEAEGEAETMRNLFCGLRERIYTLLRSADQDAQVFGMPRYTLEDPEIAKVPKLQVHDGRYAVERNDGV